MNDRETKVPNVDEADGPVTRLLADAAAGRPNAARDLLPLVYRSLRDLADRQFASERSEHTLQATALVHEAYLRLVGSCDLGWDSRAHFYGAAAEAMRRILVEQARRRLALKRGGDVQREDVELDRIAAPEPDDELLALHEALDRLAERHPEKAALVKLRYFAGLTADEAAQSLSISPSTADRHWTFARAWLKLAMRGSCG